ncbi:hypothetical protein CWI36_0491p0010, partial [Hamiltosporidium magnivora]
MSNVLSQRNIVIVGPQELESTGKRNVNKKSISLYYSCQEKHHLLGAEFMKKLNYIILNAYALAEDSTGEEKKALYALLGKVYEDCPRKYIQFLLGDMDAKIGKDYVCSRIRNYNLHKEHPENGFRLLNFAIRGNLILGTVFDRGNIHKGTLHRIKVYANSRFSLPEQTSLGKTPPKNENIAYLLKFRTLYQSEKESGKTDNWLDYSNQKMERFLGVEDWWNIALEKDWPARKILALRINKYKVWSDSGDTMDRDSNRLEVFSDRTGLEGVGDSNRLEVVSNSNRIEGIDYSTNTLHPVNTNTTSFTLWNSFVFGDCKL